MTDMIPPDLYRVARMGWHVLPVHATSRAACFRGAVDHATCNLDTIVHWAARWPGCGWWVVGGVRALCWTWHKLRCGASDPQWVWIAPVGRDGGAWFSDQPACRACFTAPPMGNDPGQG